MMSFLYLKLCVKSTDVGELFRDSETGQSKEGRQDNTKPCLHLNSIVGKKG